MTQHFDPRELRDLLIISVTLEHAVVQEVRAVADEPGCWEGAIIEGFFSWVEQVSRRFRVVIVSPTFSSDASMMAAARYLAVEEGKWRRSDECKCEGPLVIGLSATMPPASIVIEPHAIRFDGAWRDPRLSLNALLSFQCWTMST